MRELTLIALVFCVNTVLILSLYSCFNIKSREAESLINQRIHPQTIAEGWRLARKAARDALEASAIDNSKDEAMFREDLLRIARTTLSSKLVTYDKDYFANLAVDAVMRLKGSNNLDHIQILKKSAGC